jgi:chaperone required for assembly of F1-ATPase
MNINNALISYANITGNTIDNININRYATNLSITNNTINNININGSYCNITNNTIITDNEYTITGRGKDNIITDNYLVAKTLIGDNSIQLNKNTNTITNNKPYETTLQIDTTTFTIGQTANITASIYYGNDILTNISKGKVTFKVNGKTLKDANGKVIYAKIVNGTATIENYEVPSEWAKEGTTIQAVYSGSTQCDKLTSEKTNITVTPEETTLTITPLDSVTPRQTTTLKATLSDNTINTGKIVFKINGKTVKDANGKVIYAKVVNGTVSVDYTLPESYKAGNYTVTATFIASGYDRLEASETLTVTA